MKSCLQKNKAIWRIIEFSVLVLLSYRGRSWTAAEEISRLQRLFSNRQWKILLIPQFFHLLASVSSSFTIYMSRVDTYIYYTPQVSIPHRTPSRNSTAAEEVSRFQHLIPNLQSGRIYEFLNPFIWLQVSALFYHLYEYRFRVRIDGGWGVKPPPQPSKPTILVKI